MPYTIVDDPLFPGQPGGKQMRTPFEEYADGVVSERGALYQRPADRVRRLIQRAVEARTVPARNVLLLCAGNYLQGVLDAMEPEQCALTLRYLDEFEAARTNVARPEELWESVKNYALAGTTRVRGQEPTPPTFHGEWIQTPNGKGYGLYRIQDDATQLLYVVNDTEKGHEHLAALRQGLTLAETIRKLAGIVATGPGFPE